MGLISFIKAVIRVIKITRKPTGGAFKLSLRVCFLTTVMLGSIGFLVQFTASLLQTIRVPTIPKEIVLYILISILVIILAIIAYRRRFRK